MPIIPVPTKTISSLTGILINKKVFNVENSRTTEVIIRSKSMIKSTIRSAIMVPKALSKGTSLYFFKINARETSPERGIPKLTK